jgi:DNA-binding transcriptional regulator YbjK
MTDKTIKKLLVLLLLFNIALAGAFSLFSPLKPVKISTEDKIQSDKQTPEARGQPAKSPDIQKSRLELKLAAVSRPMEPLLESGDEIVNSATNEQETLDELRAWAREDPEAALTWAQQQTNNAERNEALTDACFQIAQTDPERAVLLAEQFNLDKDAVLENLAQQWTAKDLTTAYNWIAAQPAGDQRDALATGMTFIWSQTAPADAAQFVAQQMPPGSAQDEAAMMVLHQWALVDSSGASAWAQQFPESPLRNRALNELSGIARYKQGIAQSK